MTEELYKRYRPVNFKQIVGQDDAIKQLVEMGRRGAVPHCLLFTGPSGTGKTTTARILRKKLGCGDADYQEVNASSKDSRGIGAVAMIQSRMGLSPMAGKCRVWMVDEAAQLTTAAQDSLLKTLEDTPSHCFFILSTTDPQKLKRTIVTRATELKFRLLTEAELKRLVLAIVEAEGNRELSDDVMDRLIDAAEGSARKALVLLHPIIEMETEEEQLDAISRGHSRAKAVELARLMIKPEVAWADVAAVLKDLDEEPEQLRYMVLGYCKSVVLGGGRMASRAAAVMDRFQDAMYDSKVPGLVLACWDVVHQSER